MLRKLQKKSLHDKLIIRDAFLNAKFKRPWFMKLFLLLSLILCSTILFGKKDLIIATVNEEKILKSDFLKTYKESKLFVSDKVLTKKKVLNDLIARKVGIQKARRNRLEKDSAVKEKINDILYHAQISKDLESSLQKIKVSDIDVKNYYNEKKEYRVAQILLRVKAEESPENTDKIFKTTLEIHKKIQADPEKFAEFANRYSQTGAAKTGGDIGFQPPNRYPPKFFAAINGKKPGYITPPFKTPFGFHIVKILGVKEFKDINLGLYKKIIYDQKRDALLENYFVKLRKSAKVVINTKVLRSVE